MQRFGRAGAAVIDEKADRKIKEADPKFVIESGISGRSLDENVVFLEVDPVPAQRVARLSEERDPPEHLRYIEGIVNRKLADFQNLVALPNTGLIARAAGRNVSRDNFVSSRTVTIYPGDAIVMERIRAELSQAQDGGNDGRHRENQ